MQLSTMRKNVIFPPQTRDAHFARSTLAGTAPRIYARLFQEMASESYPMRNAMTAIFTTMMVVLLT